MKKQLFAKAIPKKTSHQPTFSLSQVGILQRTCNCGEVAGLTGECEACSRQRLIGQKETDSLNSSSQKREGGYHFRDLAINPQIQRQLEPTEEEKEKKDHELEQDFAFIVQKLDEFHYSDSDETAVISILKKWAKDKFTINVKRYPNGGEYLDNLFLKLRRKTKDVGIVTSQLSNYYSLIFNHFDKVDEVKSIRDQYSRLFKGDNGTEELNFGSFFWEEVKNGHVRDQIFAYFRGMGEAGVGLIEGVELLLNHPEKVLEGIGNLPSTVTALWKNKEKIWHDFLNANPEEQARIIGRLFGEAELMIVTAGAGGGGRAATAVPEFVTAREIVGLSGGAAVLSGGQAITINLGQLGVEATRLTALMSKTAEGSVKGQEKAENLTSEKRSPSKSSKEEKATTTRETKTAENLRTFSEGFHSAAESAEQERIMKLARRDPVQAGREYENLVRKELGDPPYGERIITSEGNVTYRIPDYPAPGEITIQGRWISFSKDKIAQIRTYLANSQSVILTVPRLSPEARNALAKLANEFPEKSLVVRETWTKYATTK